MVFSIKRKYLLGLGTWLQKLSLQGQESRNRTKFIETIAEELKENEATRLEIIKKYAVLGEDGEPVLVTKEDGSKNYDIPDDKLPEFQKEWIAFLDDVYSLGGPGMETRLKTMREIVLNTTEKIDPSIAVDYDAWCEAFENIEE